MSDYWHLVVLVWAACPLLSVLRESVHASAAFSHAQCTMCTVRALGMKFVP